MFTLLNAGPVQDWFNKGDYSRLQNKALTVANKIMNVFNKNDLSTIGKARKLAEEVFGKGWEAKGASIYDEGPKVNVWGIGK